MLTEIVCHYASARQKHIMWVGANCTDKNRLRQE